MYCGVFYLLKFEVVILVFKHSEFCLINNVKLAKERNIFFFSKNFDSFIKMA